MRIAQGLSPTNRRVMGSQLPISASPLLSPNTETGSTGSQLPPEACCPVCSGGSKNGAAIDRRIEVLWACSPAFRIGTAVMVGETPAALDSAKTVSITQGRLPAIAQH